MLFSVVYVVFYVKKCYMLYVHNIVTTFSQYFLDDKFSLAVVSEQKNQCI